VNLAEDLRVLLNGHGGCPGLHRATGKIRLGSVARQLKPTAERRSMIRFAADGELARRMMIPNLAFYPLGPNRWGHANRVSQPTFPSGFVNLLVSAINWVG
jgi:hypothetical protein